MVTRSLPPFLLLLLHLVLLLVLLPSSSAKEFTDKEKRARNVDEWASADLPVNADPPATCDACRTLVEKFAATWTTTVKAMVARNTASTSAAGNIEYSGELETAVSAICDASDYAIYTTAVQAGCRRLIEDEPTKRLLVKEFLSKDVINYPTLIRNFCGAGEQAPHPNYPTLSGPGAGACAANEGTPDGLMGAEALLEEGDASADAVSSECMACRDIAADALYLLRRVPVPAAKADRYEIAVQSLEASCMAGTTRRRADNKDSRRSAKVQAEAVQRSCVYVCMCMCMCLRVCVLVVCWMRLVEWLRDHAYHDL